MRKQFGLEGVEEEKSDKDLRALSSGLADHEREKGGVIMVVGASFGAEIFSQ